MNIIKNLILGSGPAGLTAAIYSSRSNLEPVLLSGNEPGGQLTVTSLVENFPGFENGILGPELMNSMREQAINVGTKIIDDTAISVDFSKKPFVVSTERNGELYAHTIIISTGASAKWLGLKGEKRLMGKGVSGCATCDGAFFKEKVVAVVGGGDSAMEDSLFVSKFASKVYLIHRRDEFRASKIMQDRVKNNPKIEIIFNSEVKDIIGEDKVVSIDIFNNKTVETKNIPLDGVFIAIGHTPNTSIFKGSIDIDDNGYIKVHDFTKTNIAGIFAAGDVSDPKYKQAISSAGMGCIASIDSLHFLEDNNLTQ
jgi:thioredoxin reductase (NADPH)